MYEICLIKDYYSAEEVKKALLEANISGLNNDELKVSIETGDFK